MNIYVILCLIIMLDATINYSDASLFETTRKKDYGTKFSFLDFMLAGVQLNEIHHQWLNSEALSYTNDKRERKLLYFENMTEIDILSDTIFNTMESYPMFLSHSSDGKLLYINYNRSAMSGDNVLAQYTVYNFSTIENNTEIGPVPKAALQNVVWSSKGHSLAFVYNNNLYYNEDPLNNSKIISITNTLTQTKYLTYGIAVCLYNGNIPIWWSSSDKHIAFLSFNTEEVENVRIKVYGDEEEPNGHYIDVPYPKAGKVPTSKNMEVKAYVYRIDLKKIFNITVPNGVPKDFYISLVRWIDDDHLLIGWQNREQNEAWLSISQNWADNKEPVSWVIYQEKASNGWVDMFKTTNNEPIIVAGERKMYIILNRVTGDTEYRNIAELTWSYTPNSIAVNKWIVTANFDFTDILYFDKLRFLYFSAILANDSKQLHMYKADIFTGNFTCISCSDVNCTYNKYDFCSNGRYIVKCCMGPSVPTYTMLEMSLNGSWFETRILVNNTELKELLSNRSMPKIEFQKVNVKINATHSIDLETKLMLPINFDKNDTTQYPLLLNTFAAPSSQAVTSMFSIDWFTLLVANLSVIVLEVDGRGTINRGRQFERAVYKNLGIVEIHDQLLATEEISKLHFVNRSQVGAYGWSYGGFVVGHLLGSPNNTLIRCGISAAPITSYDYYVTTYTERFLGLKEKNPLAYNQTDISRLAHNFKNKNLLLMHGMKDDDVHFINSAKLIQSLIAEDYNFDVMLYPDDGNSLSAGSQLHLYRTMVDFLMNCYKKTSIENYIDLFN